MSTGSAALGELKCKSLELYLNYAEEMKFAVTEVENVSLTLTVVALYTCTAQKLIKMEMSLKGVADMIVVAFSNNPHCHSGYTE